MSNQDYIELLIIGADGIRRKFVGYGELVEVDNIEPAHTQMLVKAYIAPVVDLMTGQEVARLRLGDAVSVYTNVRRPFRDMPHKMIAVGEWKGYYLSESAIERVLPPTKPSLSLSEDGDGEMSAAPG